MKNLTYNGDVKISLKINKTGHIKPIGVYKNHGTEALFKAFAMWMSGNTAGLNVVPRTIQLFDGGNDISKVFTSDEIQSKFCLSKAVTLTGVTYKYESPHSYIAGNVNKKTWLATFTAIIPNSLVLNKTTNYWACLLNDQNKPLNYIPIANYEINGRDDQTHEPIISSATFSSFPEGTSLIIEWEMYLSNPGELNYVEAGILGGPSIEGTFRLNTSSAVLL